MKKLTTLIAISLSILIFSPVHAHETSQDHTHSVDSEVIEKSLKEKGLDQAPGVVEVPKSEMIGDKPYSGFVDEDGNQISDEEYNKIRNKESGIQWANIAIVLVVLIVACGGIAGAVIARNKQKK